jgi:hypothetical protein
MPHPTRRQTLHAGATALLTATAGCNFGFGGTAEEVPVNVENADSTPHTVTVSVTDAGTRYFDRRVTVPAGETTSGSFDNPESTVEATVSAQVESGPSAARSLQIGAGSGIRYIQIRVDSRGDLAIGGART